MRKIFVAVIVCVFLQCETFAGYALVANSSPSSELQTGVSYVNKQDYANAEEWLLKAAAQNNRDAFYWLGYIYQHWDTKEWQEAKAWAKISETRDKAFTYYTKAAELGHVEAIYTLGTLYQEGGRDYKKALEYYTKAAELGHSEAMYSLGVMYENGLGLKGYTPNYELAVKWYSEAAKHGHSTAWAAASRLRASQNTSGTPSAKTPPKVSTVPAKQTPAPKQNTPAPAQLTTPVQNTLPPKKPQTPQTTAKPRIAILAFQDKSEEKNAPADAIMDMMVTELHGAEIFSLVEREQLDAIAKEINLGQSGLVDASTAPDIGKITGAQYIMTGAITLYYYSEKASGFVFPVLGASTKAKTAYVAIDIRIIDVATSQIVYASVQTGESKQTSKQSNVLLGKNYNKMVGGLLSMAARSSVMKHVSAIRAKTW